MSDQPENPPASENPATPAKAPDPTPAASSRATPGFIDKDLVDNITLAKTCQREASKPENAPPLAAREWTAGDQTALSDSLARCDEKVKALRGIRTGKTTRTDEEKAARAKLLVALDPIIKGARRKYADGSAERRAYGIGARLSSASTKALYDAAVYASGQLAPGENNAAPKDTLKGVLPAEIAAVAQLAADYQSADWAQGDAQQRASRLLAQLRVEVETILNPLRRDLQGAADQAFTHRDPINAATRKPFGLQPDRSLNS